MTAMATSTRSVPTVPAHGRDGASWTRPELESLFVPEQSATTSSLLAMIAEGRSEGLDDAFASAWRSREMARYAAGMIGPVYIDHIIF